MILFKEPYLTIMKIELLPEPKVEFANDFLFDDPKMGISAAGFYSISDNTHRSEIHYAIIGTQQNIQDLKDWLKILKGRIEASATTETFIEQSEIEDGEVLTLFDDEDFETNNDKNDSKVYINKKLNPDFPGFNKNSPLKSELLNDKTNNISIKRNELYEILNNKIKELDKINSIIQLYTSAYQELMENFVTKPDICFIVIPSEIFKKLSSVPFGKQRVNLRRKLKAEIMSLHKSEVPVQLILEDTIKGKRKQLQDMSMIAWNFVVAQYYKTSNCIPWILTDIDKNTCFIGISFHKVLNTKNNLLRSTIAQAFNREGKGLVFVGKQFEWDSKRTKVYAPHISYEYAKDLIRDVITHYKKVTKHTPTRVVVHKTTDFWDSFINRDYAEIEGINDALKEALGDQVESDLVTIKSSKINLLRTKGKYPVLRGTLLVKDDYTGILYTTGYVPYYETYPGVHMPHGLNIEIFDGESTLRTICREILALTKLNFNNCNYYSSLPITLMFAKKVGEIIQYLPEEITPYDRYYFYM